MGAEVDPLPPGARLVFTEDWASGAIDPKKWYMLQRKWGAGNNGVVPENIRIGPDTVGGQTRNVLVCEGHGDRYAGPVVGWHGEKTRVGGVIVARPFFASGRFELTMKVGTEPARPAGCVPAIWTYGHRTVRSGDHSPDEFIPGTPLYNPHLQDQGKGTNLYWSEIDFPELGKKGDFTHGLYNTFCQDKHDPNALDVSFAADEKYHTYTTDWRTRLVPLPDITDAQVAESEGFHWVKDRGVPFDLYLGNPLKRLGKDSYALHAGEKAVHWIDGTKIGEHGKYVPVMAAQLNMGVWFPGWGGSASWETMQVSFASVRVWQYDDPGDVRGILTEDIPVNIDKQGRDIAEGRDIPGT